jgi:hypothetical protein
MMLVKSDLVSTLYPILLSSGSSFSRAVNFSRKFSADTIFILKCGV